MMQYPAQATAQVHIKYPQACPSWIICSSLDRKMKVQADQQLGGLHKTCNEYHHKTK